MRTPGLTDLIGRENEIDFLLQRQRLAFGGEGQVVLISGEPGIGKSRLATALAARIAGEPHTYLRFQCSPYDMNSALRPVIVQLERAAGFNADDSAQLRLDKLAALIGRDAAQSRDLVPLFAALLSIPTGERHAPPQLSPTQQRRRTLAALLDRFEQLARRQPMLLLFEDAHWADATSLELLDLTVERVRRLPVFVLITFRPELHAPWVDRPNVGCLKLGRLDPGDVESMVSRVTGGRRLPPEVMREILAKTDGNPLFVEELTKAVLEADMLVEDVDGYRLDGPLPPLAIPATLQDLLMARLDRRAPVREIAQVGAAIGREFSYTLLRALVGRDEAALRHALDQLEEAELVFRRGEPPDALYTFKHALVRDAAYETLLKSRRHQLHGQIAHLLEGRFAEGVASRPEIVAHHFTEAGLLEPAIDYWLKAGNLALSRSANAEAVKHLRRGIELTQPLAPASDRARKELEFSLALGPAIAATEGYAAPETLRLFSRARGLLSDGGTVTEQMTVLWGVYLAHSMRAEHVAARDVARQCLALAATHQHPGLAALGHRFMGQTLWIMGAFADSRSHLERTLELCAANQAAITSYRRFGADDRATALVALSRTLWVLGYPEQAVTVAEGALERARSLGLASPPRWRSTVRRCSVRSAPILDRPRPTPRRRWRTASSTASPTGSSGRVSSGRPGRAGRRAATRHRADAQRPEGGASAPIAARSIWPALPPRMPVSVSSRPGSTFWTKHSRPWRRPTSGLPRPSSIGCVATCCRCWAGEPRPRPRCWRRCGSPGNSRRAGGSCAPPPASPGTGRRTAGPGRPVRCCSRCTIGSRRAATRPR